MVGYDNQSWRCWWWLVDSPSSLNIMYWTPTAKDLYSSGTVLQWRHKQQRSDTADLRCEIKQQTFIMLLLLHQIDKPKCKKCHADSTYLRIIMKEGVCEKEATKLVMASRTMKGNSRWEQPLPQVPAVAKPRPPTHWQSVKFCTNTHTRTHTKIKGL